MGQFSSWIASGVSQVRPWTRALEGPIRWTPWALKQQSVLSSFPSAVRLPQRSLMWCKVPEEAHLPGRGRGFPWTFLPQDTEGWLYHENAVFYLPGCLGKYRTSVSGCSILSTTDFFLFSLQLSRKVKRSSLVCSSLRAPCPSTYFWRMGPQEAWCECWFHKILRPQLAIPALDARTAVSGVWLTTES